MIFCLASFLTTAALKALKALKATYFFWADFKSNVSSAKKMDGMNAFDAFNIDIIIFLYILIYLSKYFIIKCLEATLKALKAFKAIYFLEQGFKKYNAFNA